MKFGPVPIDEAVGKILAHTVGGAGDGCTIPKGKTLQEADILAMRELGRKWVVVAEPEAGDLAEDAAAGRVARALAGAHLTCSKPDLGRVDFHAQSLGVLQIDLEKLAHINAVAGFSLATVLAHILVEPQQIVATLKVIPFALAESAVCRAETICAAGGPVLSLRPLKPEAVALILCGAATARQRVMDTFRRPIEARIEALGSHLGAAAFVNTDEEDLGEQSLAQSLRRAVDGGAGLVVLAGELAITDRRDVAPRAVERAGGAVICFGAPVDPGSLLMLAELERVPIFGAPTCIRSEQPNVVDWILPRLLSGERLNRTDIVALGHGGLLENPIRPRPSP
jgi:molybdenum cofactor cytidylyltransferase